MQKNAFLVMELAFGLLIMTFRFHWSHAQAEAQILSKALPSPIVFQASGPTVSDGGRSCLAERT